MEPYEGSTNPPTIDTPLPLEIGLGITEDIVQEYRIVCASWGTPGHHEHQYVKGNYDLCVAYAAKLDKRTKGRERDWEVPFTIQTRVVSEWEHVNDG